MGAPPTGAQRLRCSLPMRYANQGLCGRQPRSPPQVVMAVLRWCTSGRRKGAGVLGHPLHAQDSSAHCLLPLSAPQLLQRSVAALTGSGCTHRCAHSGPLHPAARGPSSGSPLLKQRIPISHRAQTASTAPVLGFRKSPVQRRAAHGSRVWVPTPGRDLPVVAAQGPGSQLSPFAPRGGAKSGCRSRYRGFFRHLHGTAPAPPAPARLLLRAAVPLLRFRQFHSTRARGFRVALWPSPQPFPAHCAGQPRETHRVQPTRSA
ncbi:hypothetical protein NDU88_003461 [Pleurodeles waltl]|uniref:Uncharacterized protein n=1 Tax=Pleurodeles waltl TaxID=8319 RepID=A0AAV7TPU2_PLEWA|nr:hypothetical protein NDU88_003461 [Pleurodeles waltl]